MEHVYWRSFPYSLVILLLVACNSTNSIRPKTPIAESTRGTFVAPTKKIVVTIPNNITGTLTPSSPILSSPSPEPKVKITEPPSFARAPVIHGLSGSSYETLFSIPVGELLGSEDIPNRYLIDVDNPENILEDGLTGIAIDCERRIILKITGGSRLFPLSEVQTKPDPTQITQGILCNDKRYYIISSSLRNDPQVSAGDILYQIHLTRGFGGLAFLDVFMDGSFYLVRDGVVTNTVVTVDQTVHYIGVDGKV